MNPGLQPLGLLYNNGPGKVEVIVGEHLRFLNDVGWIFRAWMGFSQQTRRFTGPGFAVALLPTLTIACGTLIEGGGGAKLRPGSSDY